MSIQPLYWDSLSPLLPKPVSELDQVLIDRMRDIVERQLPTLESVLELLPAVEYAEVKWQYSASSQNSDLPDSQDALESDVGDFSEKMYAFVHYLEERIAAEILLDFAEKTESFFPHLSEVLHQIDASASLAKQADKIRAFFSSKQFEEIRDPLIMDRVYKSAPKNSPAKKEELAELKTVSHPERIPIKFLYLSHRNITHLPPELFLHINLPQIDLSENAIESIPPEIEKVNFVSSLNLHQNHLFSLPRTISQLARLKTLDLSHNAFESFPKRLHLLSHLTSLDLSHNKIAEIPEEFFEILQLKFLLLSNNQIQKLPDKINQIYSLELLNLSHNPLQGIPPSVFRIHFLILHFHPYNFCSPLLQLDKGFQLPRDFSLRNLRVIPHREMMINFQKLLENQMYEDIDSLRESMREIDPEKDLLHLLKEMKNSQDIEVEEGPYYPHSGREVSKALLSYLPSLDVEGRKRFAGSLGRMWLAFHRISDQNRKFFHGEEYEVDLEALESLQIPPHIYSSIFNFIKMFDYENDNKFIFSSNL